MIDIAGGKKFGFYQRAAYWREDPVLQLFVVTGEKTNNAWQSQSAELKWNWPTKKTVTVRVSTNCDEVELFLNKRSLGRKPVSRNLYTNDWKEVNYKRGELKAVGYLKGRQVVSSNLLTTGPATKLQLTPLSIPIVSDIQLFEITVGDKNGLNVIDVPAAVTVKVEGSGRFVGLDSGDLVFDGIFKTNTRNTYQGRLLVAVQRTTPVGEIRVSASAPGLSPAIIQAK